MFEQEEAASMALPARGRLTTIAAGNPPRGRERFGRTGGRQEDPLEEASSRTAEPAAKAAEAEV
jgi:hypothetical protein